MFQQLYQTFTDYDIRFYLYELMKVIFLFQLKLSLLNTCASVVFCIARVLVSFCMWGLRPGQLTISPKLSETSVVYEN